jgi:hypothetical protein
MGVLMFEVFLNMLKDRSFHILLLTIIAGVVYLKWKESRKGYERYKKWKASQGWSDCE